MTNTERATGAAEDPADLLAELASRAQYAIYDAYRALNERSFTDHVAVRERASLDVANLLITRAKWRAGRYTGANYHFAEPTHDKGDAESAIADFRSAVDIAREAEEILLGDDSDRENASARRAASGLEVRSQGTEISFVDEVPVVPSICPVVLLKGSSYEMGRQYVAQINDIFGPWVFERVAARPFTDSDNAIIDRWRSVLEQHTPEIADMVRGWVDEAADSGVPLTYRSALQLWTGHFEPLADGIRGHGVRDLDDSAREHADASYLGNHRHDEPSVDATIDLCSGACAWGDATVDGRLVVGSTTDHDCTFQVTIVAYPDEGNAFVYTPFSINGFIPGLGQYYFAGHPGMNDKGLAYVHHGGGLHSIEQGDDRGYGLRRGASVFHNLRYADSARDALENELKWPIGDVGTILGSVGGFYADSGYGYVCEARPSHAVGAEPIVRERTFDEAGNGFDFLYANNNSMHPRSARGFSAPAHGYQYNPVEGWIENSPAAVAHLGAAQLAPALSTKSSQGRNRYLFESLKDSYGRIDVARMQQIVSTSAPERYTDDGRRMTHAERETSWLAGVAWPSSTSHRLNAFTAVMRPDADGDGIYMGCIGPADFRAIMHTPGHGYYYVDETNEFWELRLRDTPEGMVDAARRRATELLLAAQDAVAAADDEGRELSRVRWLLGRAQDAHRDGTSILEEAGPAQVRPLSRALRRLTTAQVRAKQVVSELRS